MSDKTKGYLWKGLLAVAIIAVIVWIIKKMKSSTDTSNLTVSTSNGQIRYVTPAETSTDQTLNVNCAKKYGKCWTGYFGNTCAKIHDCVDTGKAKVNPSTL